MDYWSTSMPHVNLRLIYYKFVIAAYAYIAIGEYEC